MRAINGGFLNVKGIYRSAQKIKHSTSKDEDKKAARSEEVYQAYRDYLLQAEQLIKKSQQTIKDVVNLNNVQAIEQIVIVA